MQNSRVSYYEGSCNRGLHPISQCNPIPSWKDGYLGPCHGALLAREVAFCAGIMVFHRNKKPSRFWYPMAPRLLADAPIPSPSVHTGCVFLYVDAGFTAMPRQLPTGCSLDVKESTTPTHGLFCHVRQYVEHSRPIAAGTQQQHED